MEEETVVVDTNFVVYAYIRSRSSEFGGKGTFYYIGKGRPNRPYSCGKRDRKIKCPRDKVNNILILHSNLDEQTAFLYEKLLIQLYGRIDTNPEYGVLRNMTDGGDGLANPSKETRTSKSKKMSGGNNPMYGLPRPKELREKLSKRYDWYHPEHGEVKNTSAPDLTRIFPEDKLTTSRLCEVANKKCFHHKKWVLLENKHINIKEEVKKSFRGVPYDWFHPEHGENKNLTCLELAQNFPDQLLSVAMLSCVCSGKRNMHKNWILLTNKDVKIRKKNHHYCNWEHKDFGIILDKSPAELIKMFPEQNLVRSNLSNLVNGKIKKYKGWKIKA